MRSQTGNISQRNGRQTSGIHAAGKRRELSYFIIICILLTLNLVFLLELQSQMKSMNNSLKQLLSRMTLAEQEGGFVSQADANYGRTEVDHGIVQRTEGVKADQTENQDTDAVQDYVQLCGLPAVDKPMKRTQYEVLKRLEELAKDSEIIERIYQETYLYPDSMLEALANNPEMALFVEGFPSSDGKATGGLTEAEKEQDCPLLLQWDPRWGYVEYGDESNIGLAGCGPTCLSMVLYYLLKDESITPNVIAEYSMENGYYMSGTGTAWALMKDYPALYGVEVGQSGASEWSMKNTLDQGGIIICSVKPGDFTAGGHFIVIYGYDKDGFFINDPNCVARSRQSWSFNDIGKQIKNMWTYRM